MFSQCKNIKCCEELQQAVKEYKCILQEDFNAVCILILQLIIKKNDDSYTPPVTPPGLENISQIFFITCDEKYETNVRLNLPKAPFPKTLNKRYVCSKRIRKKLMCEKWI